MPRLGLGSSLTGGAVAEEPFVGSTKYLDFELSSTNYLTVAANALLRPTTTLSISCWLNIESNAGWSKIVSMPYANSGWADTYGSYMLSSNFSTTRKPFFEVTTDSTSGATGNPKGVTW